MLSPALNYDFICYPLKTQYFNRLDISLRSEIEKLFSDIEQGLVSTQDTKTFALSQIRNLFNLKIKAIKWFLEGNNVGALSKTIEDCYNDFDGLIDNSKLIFFVENLKFALRSNKRLIDSFVEQVEANPINIEIELKALSLEITYDQFITSIALGVPDEETAQKIIDLVGASLLIEFSAISAGILIEKKIEISENKAMQLTSLIGNAAQEYSAVCYELGMFKRHKSGQSVLQFDNTYVEEQQYLADLGLDELVES